jgi:hypothetical protein
MLRHACGYALANKGIDTRTLQAYLGHRSINSTTRYAALAPGRFKNIRFKNIWDKCWRGGLGIRPTVRTSHGSWDAQPGARGREDNSRKHRCWASRCRLRASTIRRVTSSWTAKISVKSRS